MSWLRQECPPPAGLRDIGSANEARDATSWLPPSFQCRKPTLKQLNPVAASGNAPLSCLRLAYRDANNSGVHARRADHPARPRSTRPPRSAGGDRSRRADRERLPDAVSAERLRDLLV